MALYVMCVPVYKQIQNNVFREIVTKSRTKMPATAMTAMMTMMMMMTTTTMTTTLISMATQILSLQNTLHKNLG